VEEDVKFGVPLDEKSYTKAMSQYYLYLADSFKNDVEAAYAYAFSIRRNELQREIVESLILSEADFTDVEEIFEVSPEAMAAYKELFFETDNLISKLDLISYLETYSPDYAKALKLRAYNLGPNFIFYRYGNITPSTSEQQDLVKRLFLTSAYNAMEANYSKMTSATAKAASQHAGMMLKAYEAIRKLMDDGPADGADVLVKVLVGEDEPTAKTKRKVKKDQVI
jgi:hypothetical protein